MTIEDAFVELMNSSAYVNIARQKDSEGGKYRVFRGRFKKDKLKHGAMVDLLLEHGYDVTVKRQATVKKSQI